MPDEKIKRICLWSGPRNVSTALMYSFAQRSDCKVFDEPLYAHYLSHSDAKDYHPGAREIMDSMENDGERVVEMMLTSREKPVLFFKHMTHHLIDLNTDFLSKTINVILTRDPKEMIPSFHKVIPFPGTKDLGYESHMNLLKFLEARKQTPIVVDSKSLLLDPKNYLIKLCNAIGISFHEEMMNWEVGPIKEDGIWAKYWYTNVHSSEGFQSYVPKKIDIPRELDSLVKEADGIYQKLISYAL